MLPEIEDGPVQEQMEVPPGLWEEFFDSPGWESFVTTTHEFCNELSIISTLEENEGLGLGTYLDIGRIQYEVTKATIWRTSMPTLLKKLNLPAMILQEVAGQLCLAATGDPTGLKDLTGVIHQDFGYQMVFLEYTPPSIVGGQVVDETTGEPIQGVEVWLGSMNTTTLANGHFFFPWEDESVSTFIVTHPGYFAREVYISGDEPGYVRLGSITLMSREHEQCIADGSRPSDPLDPTDTCSIVKWMSYALKKRDVDDFIYTFKPMIIRDNLRDESLTVFSYFTYEPLTEGLSELFSNISYDPICINFITGAIIDGNEVFQAHFLAKNPNTPFGVDQIILGFIKVTPAILDALSLSKTDLSLSVEELSEYLGTYQLAWGWIDDYASFQDWQVFFEPSLTADLSEELGENAKVHYCTPPYLELESHFTDRAPTEEPAVEEPTPESTAAPAAPYYPLSDCAASRLHVGDRAMVSLGGGTNAIRTDPDVHPADNIIGRAPSGEEMWIVGGPECSYGWILWEVATDSGLRGWTPESDGLDFWLELVLQEPYTQLGDSQTLCGDPQSGELALFSPGWGEVRSDTLVRFVLEASPEEVNYSITGQLDDGTGGIIGHIDTYSESPSFSFDIRNCAWSFIPDYDCRAVVEEAMAQIQVVMSGSVLVGDLIDPEANVPFCVVFREEW
jgi:hypothetical protein